MQQRQFHRSFQTPNRQRISLSNEFASLIQPEDLLLKYPKLNNLSRVGALSAKLAREVYFGKNIMSKCTVYGCRDRPPLPKAQLEKMKIFLIKFSSIEGELQAHKQQVLLLRAAQHHRAPPLLPAQGEEEPH